MRSLTLVCAALSLALLSGCRGSTSSEPPVHLNPNMDSQDKLKAQGESTFFADKRAMRAPPAGTVARGFEKSDDALYRGRQPNGEFVAQSPMPITKEAMKRGQARFDIYCRPCHGDDGAGNGLVPQRPGMVAIPTYHQDRIRNMTDGELFSIITNGVKTMPSYRHQIPTEDRWAIVAYLRALQRAHHATVKDLPKGAKIPEAPKVEAPKVEAPKVEAPKAEKKEGL